MVEEGGGGHGNREDADTITSWDARWDGSLEEEEHRHESSLKVLKKKNELTIYASSNARV